MAENKKAWKNSNTLRNSLRESSEREYALFSFDPEEVHDFFVWSGWNGGYAERFLIDSVLKLTGNYKDLHGLVINYVSNKDCADSTKTLFDRYGQAKTQAVSLIHEYGEFSEGKEGLNPIYQYTFGSEKVEEEEMINEF